MPNVFLQTITTDQSWPVYAIFPFTIVLRCDEGTEGPLVLQLCCSIVLFFFFVREKKMLRECTTGLTKKKKKEA